MVDSQHKKLVDGINDLHDAMKEGKGNEKIEQSFNFLVDYTVLHFSAKEKLMQQKNYPVYNNHKKVHDTLVAEVKDIRSKYIARKVLPMRV